MPLSPTAFDAALIAQTAGKFWYNTAVPAASARLTLFTDGSPDLTANPSVKHAGYSAEGVDFLIKPSYDTYFGDEDANPLKRNVGDTETAISGTFLQVMDMALVEVLLPGIATYGTAAGYMQNTIGTRTIQFYPVAHIWPLEADPTKFGVMQLYKALNDAGFAAQLGRKKLAGTPFAFKGHAIGSRAASDTVGNFWKQI